LKKYIVTLFITIFTLNAFEADIEVVDSFDNENLEVVDTVSIVKDNKNLLETKQNNITKSYVETKNYNNIKDSKKVVKQETKNIVQKTKKKKVIASFTPQLAIIIDDVSNRSQLRALQKLQYHITPSIFPPTRMNMHSNNLAKGLKHYMVHLPLESHSRAMNKMYKMLFLKDSNKKIINRVKEIRKLFPNAKYINNHTGSVFCKNYKKSKVLYRALKQEGFIFVDSRTSKQTKFKRITREFKDKYIKSDIYIDNIKSVDYTLNQIKKGIALAKKRGYAVMIGHPHATTLKALKKATPLFKDIKMVYIDELKF